MQALTAPEVVRLWEQGATEPPAARSVALLAAACPDADVEALTIGELDGRLLELWELTFGPRLDGFVECPACAEALEFALDTTDLRSAQAADSGTQLLTEAAWEIELRPLTGGDLAAAARAGSPSEGRRTLLERCVVAARHERDEVEAASLPEEIVELIAERLEASDPQAEIRISLVCPSCRHAWSALLDIGMFLWAELGGEARRVLTEVHTLASAYGWRESDVLALGPARRQFYLEAIG